MSTCAVSSSSVSHVVTNDDLLDVVGLYRAWMDEERHQASLADFVATLALKSPNYRLFLLRRGMDAVGFMDAEIRRIPVEPFRMAVSNYFYVLPKYRRSSGLLFRAALRWMKSEGAKTLKMTTDNEDRFQFWSKHKFQYGGVILERSL